MSKVTTTTNTKAILLPTVLIEAIKADTRYDASKGLTDFVKMAVARSIKFDVAKLPAAKRGKVPTHASPQQIAKLMEDGNNDEALRQMRIVANIAIEAKAKAARKASEVKTAATKAKQDAILAAAATIEAARQAMLAAGYSEA